MKQELYFSGILTTAKSFLPVFNFADTLVLGFCFDTITRNDTQASISVVPTRAQQGRGGLIQRGRWRRKGRAAVDEQSAAVAE